MRIFLKMATKEITVREALNRALDEEMAKNKNIILIGEEIKNNGGTYGVSGNLHSKYDNRMFNMPITEYGFTGMAVGASFIGVKPIVEFMTWNFSLQAVDHIINSCAFKSYMSGGKIKSNIIFRGPNGYAKSMAAEHNHDLSTLYGRIPGLTVIVPYSASDHRGLLKKAIRSEKPIVFLENEFLYPKSFEMDETFNSDYLMEFQPKIEKFGKDVTVVGVGVSLDLIFEAQKELKYDLEIINLICVNPLNTGIIEESVQKTKRLLIVEYDYSFYSVGSEISAIINEKLFGTLKKPVKRISKEYVPTPFNEKLEQLCNPSIDKVKTAINNLMNN